MKELLTFLWGSAPELMSLLFILGILTFIVVKFTLFFVDFKNMGIRVTNLEEQVRLLHTKVDRIIDYLLNERNTNTGK